MAASGRFSLLSPSRQALVRLCQATNFGHILDMAVQDREPILDTPSCTILTDVKLDSAESARGELAMTDFTLCTELERLMRLLDEINNGVIARLEIRAGVPRRITLQKSASELCVDLIERNSHFACCEAGRI